MALSEQVASDQDSSAHESLGQKAHPRKTDWLRVGLPVVALAVFVVIAWKHGYFDLKNPQKLGAAAQRAHDIPWLAPIFIAVYAALATLAAPVSPLAYGAGAVFGVWRGSLYVMLASIVGAAAGYFLARSAWSGVARRVLGRFHDKLRDLRHGNVFLVTFRMQLLPIMPFGIFNYAAGVGRLPFWRFLAGTAFGILPGTIAAVYVGDRLMAGLTGSDKHAFIVAGAVAAALFALSFAPTLMKKLRGTRD